MVPACDWNAPGADPLQVQQAVAVMRYHTEIPPVQRALLAAKVAAHQYDDQVTIRRDSIKGRFDYAPKLEHMTFGNGRMCHTVRRSGWSASEEQGALVYVVGRYALGVAAVCGNTFRVTFAPPAPLPPVPGAPAQPEPVRTVPEPGTLAMVLAGVALAVALRRGGAK